MNVSIDSLGKVISERFKIEQAHIVPDATLEALGFDSLSTVDLVVLLERKLGLKISDAKVYEIEKISDILAVANGGA
ncbi:acyl carrier protein [Paraburkholderia nemoris]|jgi:acyl carrier protein|uniref:Acyl carrier protein n=1 Tax=Paraburkholderia nemoris TaxID=2793076 RepID=A0ABN7M0S6_9BURK|nr:MULTISPECIES: acyl carrier protein [Paraburkholderia]KPD19934.1 acyl carrier protein [Burkholderia sp. ST111]MBK3739544.1 acyl carrier protein [Paraburkholderia aspalathi]MBK3782539.1 acyl carrier protein [Paraburkholderia aspalathi]MBK3812280.1 acyl carrier protein [Paraburkholderia aspalathi]CAE6701384.1 Acyl carrier protein [Paraburkholderia nemoris]